MRVLPQRFRQPARAILTILPRITDAKAQRVMMEEMAAARHRFHGEDERRGFDQVLDRMRERLAALERGT